MSDPHLPKDEMTESQLSIHAKNLFGKSNKITAGWISAKLWVNGIYVSRAVIHKNAKILKKMLEKDNEFRNN